MRLAAFALLLVLVPASAETAAQRLTGTIESYAAPVLTVKTAKGSVAITLAPEARIVANEKALFASIKQGDFIASTAAARKDGRLVAKEVRLFPAALRGLGEGQYPHDDASLTNATVTSVVAVPHAKGGVLKLSFHGSTPGPNGMCSGHAPAPGVGPCSGDAEIVVTPKTTVTTWLLGDATWLQIGKAVSLFAVTDASGKLSSPGVLVEHNGVKPVP
ncbi:MAG: hypothetical protein P4L57_15365 [Rhizomicrobium sp.]|nr:hypothetical protein [Rhizomicrobium sp.]